MTENATAVALLQIADNLQQILEAVRGYRTQIEAQGFSPTAAEVMSMEYHSGLMRVMFAGTGAK